MRRGIAAVLMVFMCDCGRVSITQDSFTPDPDIEALITVPKGHSCDPGALMQAIVLKYPGIDPVAARQKVACRRFCKSG
jgi:hypothetical protein